MQSTKLFVSAAQLQDMSQELALQVLDSQWQPDFMVALWRGGSMVGCYVHEMLNRFGPHPVNHIAVRTSLYSGVDQVHEGGQVLVHGEQFLVDKLQADSRVLFVDDILESGRSLAAVQAVLRRKLGDRCPRDMRVATLFTKSERWVQGNPRADFYIRDCARDQWVSFPHELEDLSNEEVHQVTSPQVFDALCKRGYATK